MQRFIDDIWTVRRPSKPAQKVRLFPANTRTFKKALFQKKKKKKAKNRDREVQQTAILDFSSYQLRLHAGQDPKFYRHSPVLFVRSLTRLIVLLSFDRRMNVDHVWDYNW